MATAQLNASYPEWLYGSAYHHYTNSPGGSHPQRDPVIPYYGVQEGSYSPEARSTSPNWGSDHLPAALYLKRPLPSPNEERSSAQAHSDVSPPPERPVKRLRSGNTVPRPRNAFMIYRSEFWSKEKISKTVERDHRLISRIIGNCWNQLPDAEKDIWRQKAAIEKEEHQRKYPGYRFTPSVRSKERVKRNVKRNSPKDHARCDEISRLILSGKQGDELVEEVKRRKMTVDEEMGRFRSNSRSPNASLLPSAHTGERHRATPSPPFEASLVHYSSDESASPVFRSPLLPAADISTQLELNNPPLQNNEVLLNFDNYSSLFQGEHLVMPEHTTVPPPMFPSSVPASRNVSLNWPSPLAVDTQYVRVPRHTQPLSDFAGHYMAGDRSYPMLSNRFTYKTSPCRLGQSVTMHPARPN